MDDQTILEECQPMQRRLSAWEISEANKVFGDRLDYSRVKVHECSTWTNFMDRLGRKLRNLPAPDVPNAITIRNSCYFPVKMLYGPVPIWHPDHYKISWLIHELTHVWQYQKLGISYISKALGAQFRGGVQTYDFGGENGLLECNTLGKTLDSFSLEQQGEICRSYYNRLVRGEDISAWLPYILEIQNN